MGYASLPFVFAICPTLLQLATHQINLVIKRQLLCARINILTTFKLLNHHSKNRINIPPPLSLDKGAEHQG